MGFLKKIIVISLSVALLFSTMSSVSALEEDVKTFTIDGIQYIVETKEDENYRYALVTASNGDVSTSKYSKVTGELIVDGEEVKLEEEAPVLQINAAALANVKLSSSTYVFSGTLIGIIATITVFSPFNLVQFISAIASAFISGKDLLTTITKWRSGSKMTSGTYKGKYKYWTNVQMKFRGSGVFLNENHSTYYG